MSEKLRIKKLDPLAIIPTKAHKTDLGYDLFALEHTLIMPSWVTKVRTGISCKFPTGFGAIVKDRSSVASNHQIFVKAGVIDETYTGEIVIIFFNPHINATIINAGDKVAQMILVPTISKEIEEVDELVETERGSDGFGSSGT